MKLLKFLYIKEMNNQKKSSMQNAPSHYIKDKIKNDFM